MSCLLSLWKVGLCMYYNSFMIVGWVWAIQDDDDQPLEMPVSRYRSVP